MLKSILLSTKYTTSSSSSFLESEELVGERFSAIHNDHLVKDDDNNNNNENSYPDYAGNLSFQQASSWCNGNYYSSSFCSTSCSDEHFLQRIVRWVKIIARSQQLMTVVFGFVPLVVGLLIGVYIGRKWEQRQQLRQQQQPKQKAGKLNSSSVLSVWLSESLHFVASKAMWIIGSSITSLVFIIMTAYVPSTEVPFNNDKETRSPEPQKEITEEERLSYIKNPNRYRQSGLETKFLPKHIAIIMDGNRRYGKQKYNSASRGHSDGGYKLRDMVQWCLEECVQEMTVYAFSTENWNRSPTEIDALMTIFVQQCEALRKESIKLQIVVRILSTDTTPIPNHVKEKLKQLEDDTRHCKGSLYLNVCLSYGSRGEIVKACQSLAMDCRKGTLEPGNITEDLVESRLLTSRSPAPDILLRTSGELRLSNFLLWQCAYSELFFLSKHWPDLEKEDFLEVLKTFAHGRKRRFGV